MDASAWASSKTKEGYDMQIMLIDHLDGRATVISVDANGQIVEYNSHSSETIQDALTEYLQVLLECKKWGAEVIIRK